MPLVRYALYAQGVDIYIAPTYDNGERWLATLQHIAREGGCFVVGSGCAFRGRDLPESFPERDRLYPSLDEWVNGRDSAVVAPGGKLLSGPMRNAQGVLYAELDMGLISAARQPRRGGALREAGPVSSGSENGRPRAGALPLADRAKWRDAGRADRRQMDRGVQGRLPPVRGEARRGGRGSFRDAVARSAGAALRARAAPARRARVSRAPAFAAGERLAGPLHRRLARGGRPRAVVQALAATGMVVDRTVEGMLHAPELPRILAGGTRLMMVSNEHPEVLERTKPTPELRERVVRGIKMLAKSKRMRVTSQAGTELEINVEGAAARGATGIVDKPKGVGYWPAGLCLCFPKPGSVNGALVLAPGDVNLTFKRYIEAPVCLAIENDYVTKIEGDGLDAALLRSYYELARPRGLRHLARRLGREPRRAARSNDDVRPQGHQRHRAARVCRQLPFLHRRQRDGGALHRLPFRLSHARLHGGARRRRGRRRGPAGTNLMCLK